MFCFVFQAAKVYKEERIQQVKELTAVEGLECMVLARVMCVMQEKLKCRHISPVKDSGSFSLGQWRKEGS